MRKIFITIASFLMCTSLYAQILYECKSPKGDTVVYLLGTCHRLPKDAYLDTILLATLMRNAEVIFSELYVKEGDANYGQVAANLTSKLRFMNQGDLSDSVTKDEYAQIRDYYKTNYGISAKTFRSSSHYRPWLMHQKLAKSDKTHYFLDNLIYHIARRTGNKIVNLDNEALREASYAWLNDKYTIQWIIDLTRQTGTEQMSDDDKIEKFYLLQDTASIATVVKANPEYLPGRSILIDDRNRYWQAVLEKNMRRTNFIYGGLAHVILGDYSLLNYFSMKQYSIRAMTIDIKRFP